MTLSILPPPRTIETASGSFTVSDTLSILLSVHASRAEWVSARAVEAALERRGVDAPISPRARSEDTRGCIVLAVAERDEEVFPHLTTPSPSGNGVPSGEAYRLTIEPDRIVVMGASPAGLIQGARTLIGLLDTSDALPCLTIDDAPALPWRGVMLDISRGKVPTLATLRHIVDVIASFKLNMFQLYMENTFAFRSHPKVGAGWGAMTPEDVRELDDYCRDRAIELVPCFQSLGHHRRLLSLPEYSHLAYSPEHWTLKPGEEAWRFLEELYDDLLPAFSSRYVNVCCDEPYDLTHVTPSTGGEEPTPVGARSQGMRLYLEHIQRLHEILRVRGKTMMIWDDIFGKAPEMRSEMPSDTIFLCWEYEAAETYPHPEGVRDAGRASMVCPGTSTWNTLAPRLENARVNIRNFVRSGLNAGSIGVLTTDWGDNGHPNFLGMSFYGYAYGASEGWSPNSLPDEEFDRRFARLAFGAGEGREVMDALRLMAEACTLPGIARHNNSYSRAMFFRDVLADETASRVTDNAIERVLALGRRALHALTPLQGIDAKRAQTLDEMRLAARQIIHAARKTQVGRELASSVPDDTASRETLYAELDLLKRDLHELRREYQRLWLARNKPEGMWITLDQFDTAAAVLDGWRSQVARPYIYGQ